MQMANLFSLLKSTTLKVTYHHWTTPPVLPYLVYLMLNTDNFSADNKVYNNEANYSIELYTAIKDLASEKLVEDMLNDNDIFWDKTEIYIKAEKMYQITYSI